MKGFIQVLLHFFLSNVTTLFIWKSSSISTVNAIPKLKILSFGGNGQVGSITLSRLISTGMYDITLVSRGSWPFDTSTLIKPHVKHIECDREFDLEDCEELVSEISETDNYHAVLDFSGFLPIWIENAIDVLDENKAKVRVYIYISSDSVYEVCGDGKRLKGDTRLFEMDAERPEDEDLNDELIDGDEYGDEKLGGEEVLVDQGKTLDGFPYVFLRFADVIGARDQTDRFITYVLWAKLLKLARETDNNVIPNLHIPTEVLKRSSVTYVEDAAESIILAMNTPSSWKEAYNVASEEVFNVTQALEFISKHIIGQDYTPNVISIDNPDNAVAMYPSVTRGPVDISKAQHKLKFVPTPLEEVLKKTIDWFEQQLESDPKYKNEMIRIWFDNLVGGTNDLIRNQESDKIMNFIKLEFGINMDEEDINMDDDYDEEEL